MQKLLEKFNLNSKKGIENLEVTIPILKNKLNCEEYLRFGFEIEALINESVIKLDMMKLDDSDYFNNKGFFGTGEMILYDDNEYGGVDNCIGGEVVTPILKDSEETWIDITKVCEYLNRYAKRLEQGRTVEEDLEEYKLLIQETKLLSIEYAKAILNGISKSEIEVYRSKFEDCFAREVNLTEFIPREILSGIKANLHWMKVDAERKPEVVVAEAQQIENDIKRKQ